jgi:hypothetical protein
MFEQIKREQLNQASRKVQTSKFELSRLENKREEIELMQSRLKEELAEIEKHIGTVKEEIVHFINVREQIETGDRDFEIKAELLSDITVRQQPVRQQLVEQAVRQQLVEQAVRQQQQQQQLVEQQVRQQQQQQQQQQQPLVRSVSAERKRDVTTNPRYPYSEFWKNFGSNTRLYIKISSNEPDHGGFVDVVNRVIVADQPVGGNAIFRSFNEWTVAHVAELNKQRNTKTSKSAYNVIWYQDKSTGEWISLLKTAVVGNVIN